MLKKVVNLFLLTLPFVLYSCVKDGGRESSQFVVSGIRDVILDGGGSHVLPITVKMISGTPEPVDIDVFGLPTGISVSVTPENGLPDFSSELNFFQGGPPGIYRVKVVTTSAHYRREDSLLVIAQGNDFTVSGARDISINSVTHTDTMSLIVAYASGRREEVQLDVLGLPKGVYANFQPLSGTPDFSSKVVFVAADTVKQGIYPVKIYGRNSSYSKPYAVNLNIP